MLGKHCLKTWSATQGAVALSSAEAEFYAMIEAITRAKGVVTIMKEMGFNISAPILLFTDSSAAKSFVSRQGLGKMKHLGIRDLWLQREVGMNRVIVHKVDGTRNPADLMTKYLKRWEIEVRLGLMGMTVVWDSEVKEEDKEELAKEVYMVGRVFLGLGREEAFLDRPGQGLFLASR